MQILWNPKSWNHHIIGKTTFNIHKTTIHSTLAITLSINLKELKRLIDEKWYNLIKTYINFVLIINCISLIGNRMSTFIDNRLWVIK
jgi:maltodextrin utilization protein YvdJ